MNRTACFFAGIALAALAPHFVPSLTPDSAMSAESSRDDKADKATDAAKKRKKVEALLEVMNHKEITQRSLDASLETFTEMGLPESFQTCFKENFEIAQVMEFTTDIYAEHLEESTIDGLITFYKSDAGKAYVEAMPDITIDGLKKGTEYGKKVGLQCSQGR